MAQLFTGCFIEVDLVIQVCDMAGSDRFHCTQISKSPFRFYMQFLEADFAGMTALQIDKNSEDGDPDLP